jgi:hypothetical protein
MRAFKIKLKTGDFITIYPKNGPCEIIVAGEKKYSIVANTDAVDLILHIPVRTGLHEPITDLDIVSIQEVADNREEVFKLHPEQTNCCSIGAREWCVKNGCMNAPCGLICG